MRELARFPDKEAAERLGDILLAAGIESTVNVARDGHSAVWVHDEAHLPQARALFGDFQSNPGDPRFAEAVRVARERRRKEQEAARARPRIIQVRGRWLARERGIGPLSAVLIGLSAIVALVTRLGSDHDMLRLFTFASYEAGGGHVRWDGLRDILGGQIYRVLTPVFIHYGPAHFIFNMWWLKDLGTQIERRHSSWLLGALVIVIAAASNSAQYLVSGPTFGGMSGVVYGLFGYIWLRGRLDAGSGYALSQQEVVWMMIWLLLCYTGLVGPVANTAHTVGLATGALWGLLASGYLPRRLRRR